MEQRKKFIGRSNVPTDKMERMIMKGFTRAKNDQMMKRQKIIKQNLFLVASAVILVFSFTMSIRVSPAFAKTVATIPGLDRIVALIQDDSGLMAAVENDFYQPINLSQSKNGVTITLDGLIADRKGMVGFYSIQKKNETTDVDLKYIQLRKGVNSFYNHTFPHAFTVNFSKKISSSTIQIDNLAGKTPDTLAIGLNIDGKLAHFKIPFTYEKKSVESKSIPVNKEVLIEGQRIEVKELIIDPIRTVIKLETDPNNSKKLVLHAFDHLKLVNERGELWTAAPGNSWSYLSPDKWEVPLSESLYFDDSQELTLTFGRIAALDKEDAYILIDSKSGTFVKEPSKSIFSNLQVENGTINFNIKVNEEYDTVIFPSFIDATGREFLIDYGNTSYASKARYVTGKLSQTSEGNKRLEVQLPKEGISNPLRFNLDFYPSWIEGNSEVKIK